MADIFTKKKRSEVMGKIRGKGTKIEKIVEKFLRKEGFHFQTHYRIAGCRPDIAFPKRKIAVFVDGDFWHGWQYPRWKKKLPAKYWQGKIEANIRRDKRYFARLRRRDWKVIRIWEHQLHRNTQANTFKKLIYRIH
ncbi:MAG: hypothetical protein A2854_01305 [Parcubacteria group bacterium RIFCSPHIGHO2_01_FULL_56_18]|nr:MAG: hypothetical protein A2854_01305 [Parcubacteria group bacterium RIFCSPHIGHO2_01_FULL_56_18]